MMKNFILILSTLALFACSTKVKNINSFETAVSSYITQVKGKRVTLNKESFENHIKKHLGPNWSHRALAAIDCKNKMAKESLDAVLYFNTGIITPNDFNPSAKYRLDEAARIYKKYLPKHVILAGNNHPGASKTAAKTYIMTKGVPEQVISLESESNTTWSNIENSVKILRDLGIKKVHFIASAYHLERIFRYYEKQFPKNSPELEIYWSSFDPALNTKQDRYVQILHESYSVPRDHIKYGNKLVSKICEKKLTLFFN